MATKDIERKALEKIRKIVEELGEDSYIGMAMVGVLEDAESNIEYDWALSMNDRWQDAEKKADRLADEVEELKGNVASWKRAAEDAEERLEKTYQKIEFLREQYKEADELACDELLRSQELLAQNSVMENEIMRLKARLFDLMEKGEQS